MPSAGRLLLLPLLQTLCCFVGEQNILNKNMPATAVEQSACMLPGLQRYT
jgi:hypothetical protein